MKTLILACNTGEGHNSTATAIGQAFDRHGVPCDRADSLAFLSRIVSSVVCAAHEQIYRHAPRVFEVGYRAAEQHPRVFRKRSLVRCLLTGGADKLKRYIEDGGYDTVICTHVFSALMVTGMREKYPDMAAKFFFVATDYTCSPIVGECQMETFFIPDEALADDFIAKGVPRERIVAAGLPVRAPFLTSVERQEAKRMCGLPTDQKHLLVMCGSMGCGPLEELTALLAEQLAQDAVVSVICGTNRELYRKLCRRFDGRTGVRVLGYVQNVPELMDASELYLTKPGGISVTEATIKGLPMVLVNAVAGCEEYNLRYCLERGLARTAQTPAELAELCGRLLADDGQLESMRQAMAVHAHADAAERILDYVTAAEKRA